LRPVCSKPGNEILYPDRNLFGFHFISWVWNFALWYVQNYLPR
jgi:hypothetical protein